jgi:hypothetical protein
MIDQNPRVWWSILLPQRSVTMFFMAETPYRAMMQEVTCAKVCGERYLDALAALMAARANGGADTILTTAGNDSHLGSLPMLLPQQLQRDLLAAAPLRANRAEVRGVRAAFVSATIRSRRGNAIASTRVSSQSSSSAK